MDLLSAFLSQQDDDTPAPLRVPPTDVSAPSEPLDPVLSPTPLVDTALVAKRPLADPELKAAQDRSAWLSDRLAASAIADSHWADAAHRQAHGDVYEAQQRAAQLPVEQLLKRRESAAALASLDIDSDLSKSATLLAQAQQLIPPGTKITAAQWKDMTEGGKVQAQREAAAANNKLAEAQFGYQRQNDQTQREFLQQQANSSQGFQLKLHAQDKAAELQKAREEAAQRAAYQHEKEVGDDVEKLQKDEEPLVSVRNDLRILSEAAGKNGDVPGVGAWDSRKPGFLQSQDDTEVQEAINRVIAAKVKAQSGAVASESEVNRIKASYGLQPGGTEPQFREGVKSLTQEMRGMAEQREKKYGPDVLNRYHGRGGVGSESIPTMASGDVKVKIGGKVGTVPREKLGEAKAKYGAVEVP
jgi:hypothetical protein